ncbi:MFS general substrate transporter [Gymnopus androsaceus JB14]|uniref:MFS general substrate transporter n=1 Tax=Gymnopus androsaceus JB14 TaxID=1447944 RepID=A0A6A4I9T6_9AGAR|nr:MFS general substrate transporter [Gymnopus androsaceus JB14]
MVPGSQDIDETTPLLLCSSSSNVEAQNTTERVITPLPKAQLAVLCLVRMGDPIAFTQVFPYIPEFTYACLGGSRADPSQVAYFSGLVESIFAISQLLCIIYWARLSDKFGRRPVIMTGTLGVGIATMYFGLSKTIADLLVSRFIAGVFAGTASVMHTILGEITDSTNQAAAFPLYGLVWPALIGGTFSTPAAKFSIFEKTIFDRNPYFLPCFVSGLLSITAFILAYFCMNESLPSKRFSAEKSQTPTNSGSIDNDSPVAPPSAIELLSFPIIRALSLSGCALEINGSSFAVLFVLFCYTPIQNGGLAFPPSTIGYSLAFAGLILGAAQVFIMPILLRRYEAAKIYNMSIAAWPITFLIFPTLNMIARFGLDENTGQLSTYSNALLWVGIVIVLTLSRIGCIAFSASMILIRNNVPKPSYLGSVNGLVQSSMCFSRCFAPAFARLVFLVASISYNILGGYFWAVFHACIALIGCSLARNITRHSRQ